MNESSEKSGRRAARQAAAALEALNEVADAVATGHPADATLAAIFRRHREFGSRDRRFISAVVFSYFRWHGWLRDLPRPRAVSLAYALDAEPAEPAAAFLSDEKIESWGSLPLAEKRTALASVTGSPLTVGMLVPDWFADAAAPLFAAKDDDGRGTYERLVESFQARPPTWLRICNNHHELVEAALRKQNVEPRRHEIIRDAICFDGGVNLDIARRETGPVFEVQDIASQVVGLVCAPTSGQRWWDVCAGAGGKTLHLADQMDNRGEIIATDIRDDALVELKRRVADAGATCIRTHFGTSQPKVQFDGVLVDAPCSGTGTWSRNPDMRWRTAAETVTEKAAEQLEILFRAADGVMPGGALVYSVCTLTHAETEGVAGKFLRARPDFAPLPFANPLADRRPLTSDPAIAGLGSLWLWPWLGPGIGMFITKFRRA